MKPYYQRVKVGGQIKEMRFPGMVQDDKNKKDPKPKKEAKDRHVKKINKAHGFTQAGAGGRDNAYAKAWETVEDLEKKFDFSNYERVKGDSQVRYKKQN